MDILNNKGSIKKIVKIISTYAVILYNKKKKEIIPYNEIFLLKLLKWIHFMILFKENDKAVFHHGVDIIAEHCSVARITYNPAEKIKIHHAAAHAKPVIIPA